jgi:hypothetical protein
LDVVARHFHRLLSEPPADQQQSTNGKPIVEPQQAAIDGTLAELPPRPEPRRPVDPDIKGQAAVPMVCIS